MRCVALRYAAKVPLVLRSSDQFESDSCSREDNVTTLLDGPTFLLDIFFSWMSFLLQRRAVAKRPENRLGGPVPGRYYRLLSLDESEQRVRSVLAREQASPAFVTPLRTAHAGAPSQGKPRYKFGACAARGRKAPSDVCADEAPRRMSRPLRWSPQPKSIRPPVLTAFDRGQTLHTSRRILFCGDLYSVHASFPRPDIMRLS